MSENYKTTTGNNNVALVPKNLLNEFILWSLLIMFGESTLINVKKKQTIVGITKLYFNEVNSKIVSFFLFFIEVMSN